MKKGNVNDFNLNPFNSLFKDWALVTVESEGKVNTLTIGWGGFGVLWQKNVATIYIRPNRYSKGLIDKADKFSITFLPDGYRNTLLYCGQASGRDEDKIAKSGLTLEYEDGVPYFSEGKLVIVAKKIYSDAFRYEGFEDKSLSDKIYPEKDYHAIYIAEIEQILLNE